jgi:hypothetical protein
MKVTDASGNLLSGAELVLKNESGKVLSVNKVVKFNSDSKELVWTGVLPEGNYYLSEVKAPSGYLPTPDVAFTVESGKTTEVVLTNKEAKNASPGITVGIQNYVGENLLYAQDTSSGEYAAEGRYTRYAALFSDAALTQKVTDVQQITLQGFAGSVKFSYLESGKTYYVAETDQYGQVLTTSKYGGTLGYTQNGALSLGNSDGQMIIRETYSSLPTGFRYTAQMTFEKVVQDSTGNAKAVTDSFYVGIFREADYSGTPTVIRIDLNNASSAAVTKRVLLSGENDVTYYIAEVDQNGKLIGSSSSFTYTSTVDKPEITLTKGSDVKVTVTNKEKVSKVTLYLTKRVYDGTSQKKVTDTFYAGLFKDAEFTQLYTSPIAMNLTDSSTTTLKLTLNLGNASEATIYVAEVDKDGNIVQSGADFGYEVKMINSTVAFTQERTEIQAVLINTVYGTASQDDWNQIVSNSISESNGLISSDGTSYTGSGYSDYVSDNGTASVGSIGSESYDTGAVQTGDTTPWEVYMTFLIASGLILLLLIRRKRRA